MVLRLLTGAAPSQNLSENFSNKILFDWRQMVRWGISESRLPPNSEIYFREKAVWEQYLWQIMFVSAIVLVQAGLILILQHEHRRRRLAARLTGMPGGGTFTALFSRNACYARMNRNLVDCACKRAKIPESISALSSR
jgi:hypothetical protein